MNEPSRFLSFIRSVARHPRLPRSSHSLLFSAALILWSTVSHAQAGGTWRAEGPAPNTLGQVENIVPDDEVSGAVHTVVTHPTNANIMWVGAVNGGIWRTNNARATSPTWVEQTPNQRSLSIGGLDLDPTDPTNNTLVAGVGIHSSLGFNKGGERTGLLRTTNGGATWTPTGAGLATSNISGVAARGNVIVAAANFADPNLFSGVGIFRSVDAGATFTQISGAAGTGLADTQAIDLVGDPNNPSRLFMSTRFASGVTDGIFRSDDTGATWTRVSNAEMEGLLSPDAAQISLVEIAVGQNNNVFVGIPIGGFLQGLFRSGNGGNSWVRMDTPAIHNSGQGSIHMSIAADPTNASIVYLGGDAQDLTQFPNAIGAFDFSSTAHRCDAARARGSQCVHLTHSNALGPAGGGTASLSSPHADSREMAFDADGNLIETDDGGIYKRTNPRSDQGDWFSMIGNLATTEFHDIAYDSNSNTILGGAQDTGTPSQIVAGSARWFSVATADGGDVAVDDTSTPGVAIRYSSFQNLGGFRRQTRNANNQLISQEFSPFTVLSGPSLIVTFAQPYEINLVDPDRLMLHAFSAAYESFDRGDSFTAISLDATLDNARIGADPVAYGARNNSNIVYLSGVPDRIFVRTGAPGSAVVQSTSFPGTGSGRFIIDIAIDPGNGNAAFVVDDERVFRTQNAGASWSDITGNLRGLDPGFLRANVYIENGSGDALAVGTDRGVFVARQGTGFSSWQRLGSGLPSSPVFDLDYDPADDLLVAGMLGRGAFTLRTPLDGGNSPPIVSISAPADGATFDQGATINFTGTATDAEDGNLTNGISWTADGAGFGSGGSASISTLSIGAHAIVASVTDSGNETRTDTITVNVRAVGPGGDGLDDDFETGAPGWTAEGLWHLVSNSNCSPGFNSPVSAFYYGQDAGCSYDTGAANSGNLTSPAITGIGTSSTLSFAFRRQVESFNGDFDRTIVEVSDNGGATFTTVLSLNATDASQNAWIQNPAISLATFGPTIRVRFRFETVDAQANNFLGWMIDDVVVTADNGGDPVPIVSITAPADGAAFDEGTTITFSGTAADAADGNLSNAIAWSSGGTSLGTGATINAILPVGTNTVTARVTNSAGLSATDSISVIVRPVQAGDCLFDAGFGGGTDGFIFVDDAEDPVYADGSAVAGALELTVGGVDDADISNMQAAWERSCTSNAAQSVRVTVQGSLTQSQDYEANETSELRLVVNGQTTVLASFDGDGNGAPDQTTGLSTFTTDVTLPAGANTVAVACFNNLKTFNNEVTNCSVDNVNVAPQVVAGGCTTGTTLYEGRFESGADGWTTDPSQNCTTGTFVAGTPDAVTNGGVVTQVSGAATGNGAFFTQPNAGGAGVDDVDGGGCSSLSPVIDTSGFSNIEIAFNFFHGQRDAGDDAQDFFAVELSTNGGASFTQGLESSLDVTSNAVWTASSNTIPGTAAIRLRVRASDGTADTDLIEAGLDDVLVCGVS